MPGLARLGRSPLVVAAAQDPPALELRATRQDRAPAGPVGLGRRALGLLATGQAGLQAVLPLPRVVRALRRPGVRASRRPGQVGQVPRTSEVEAVPAAPKALGAVEVQGLGAKLLGQVGRVLRPQGPAQTPPKALLLGAGWVPLALGVLAQVQLELGVLAQG